MIIGATALLSTSAFSNCCRPEVQGSAARDVLLSLLRHTEIHTYTLTLTLTDWFSRLHWRRRKSNCLVLSFKSPDHVDVPIDFRWNLKQTHRNPLTTVSHQQTQRIEMTTVVLSVRVLFSNSRDQLHQEIRQFIC